MKSIFGVGWLKVDIQVRELVQQKKNSSIKTPKIFLLNL